MLITYILIAVAFYNFAFAGVILHQTMPHQPGRNFAWFLFWQAIWIITGALLLNSHQSRVYALWLTRLAFFCDTCWGICWLLFTADFPIPARRFRLVALILAVIGVPWLGICWSPLIVQNITARPWWGNIQLGHGSLVYSAWLCGSLFAGFLHLVIKRRVCKGIERLQLHYILLGTVVFFLIALVFNLLLPALTGSSNYIYIGLLSTIIPTTTITTAIVRHRLMGLTVLVRHGVMYILCLTMLMGCFILLSFVQHVPLSLAAPIDDSQSQLSTFAVLAMSLAFYPVWRGLQYLIDRYLFKSLAGYQQTIRYCGEQFAALRDPSELITLFQTALQKTLAPQFVTVFLPQDNETFISTIPSNRQVAYPTSLHIFDQILVHVMSVDEIILADEYIRYHHAHQEIGELLKDWGVSAIVPFIAGNSLCGFAFLGEKRFGDPYTIEDVDLLRILGKGASVALDNAFHYNELQDLNAELEERVQERTEAFTRANASLEEERAYLATAIDMLPIPLYFAVPGTKYPRVERYNKALETLLGHMSENIRQHMTLMTMDTHTPVRDNDWPDQRAFMGEQVIFREFLLAKSDGLQIPVVVYAAPIYIDNSVVATVVAFQDVTQLKEADRAKDEFLALISHELLTPLTSILGWAEVGISQADDHMMYQSLEVILRNAVRQRRLINDLLDLSRIQHNKLSLEYKNIDLGSLCAQTVSQFQPLAVQHHISMTCSISQEPLIIYADADRIIQVVSNLLNNATKYTYPNGEIHLTCEHESDNAVLTVRDTGRGIPAEAIDEVFLPFQQVTKTDALNGLGLGLSLVKGIVELHNGIVKVESPGVDQGSTFSVILPLVKATSLVENA
ncbi:MAG TPA: ATP-binding protein [Armatimonadota bacterium]|nr:ATP-binding protein [Armatimonadota bacterium]